jgi:hypothetical protein
LFRTTDGGKSWHEMPGLRGHGPDRSGAGRRGLGLHTILLDPGNRGRMFIAISAAGAFRSDDAGTTWKPINQGLRSQYIPDPTRKWATASIASRCTVRARTLFMQKHWDVMRSDNAGESWTEVSGNLPTDFGFVIDVHATSPRRSTSSRSRATRSTSARRQAAVYRSRPGGNEWEALTNGLPQRDCYVNVLRESMSVDRSIVRRVLRNDGRPGVRVERRGRQLVRDRARSARRHFGGGADVVMIRIELPITCATSRASARSRGRRRRPVTQRAVLDALEDRYPVLRGTIRDHVTLQRRPFLRFFACEQDLSHEEPDTPLPDAVARGKEPFMVVGAIAGG